jgi:hypothetical protein
VTPSYAIWVQEGGDISVDSSVSSGKYVRIAQSLSNPYVAFVENKMLYVKYYDLPTKTWQLLGGALNTNSITTRNFDLCVYVNKKIPCVCWVEDDASGKDEVYVKYWDKVTANWVSIGSGINKDVSVTSLHISSPFIKYDGSKTYVAFAADDSGGVDQVWVAYWNGSSWVCLGGSLNVDTKSTAYPTDIVIAKDGTIYVALTQQNGAQDDAYVKYWDGTAWQLAGKTYLDTSSTITGGYTSLAMPSYTDPNCGPYAAWYDGGVMQVALFNKSTNIWTLLGSPIHYYNIDDKHISIDPLNPNALPYVAYVDGSCSSPYQTYVLTWDGSSNWTLVGTGSLNVDPAQNAGSAAISVFNNKVRTVWTEQTGSGQSVYEKIWLGK